MPAFAVHYTYDEQSDARAEHLAAHRAFLRDLLDEGILLAGGAYRDEPPGALLLFRADTAADVGDILDRDPYRHEGLVAAREIRLWSAAIGPWAG